MMVIIIFILSMESWSRKRERNKMLNNNDRKRRQTCGVVEEQFGSQSFSLTTTDSLFEAGIVFPFSSPPSIEGLCGGPSPVIRTQKGGEREGIS